MLYLPDLTQSKSSRYLLGSVLTIYFRFAPQNLSKIPSLPSYASLIDAITATDADRVAFLELILRKLGLNVNEKEQAVPSLSRLHLTSHNSTDVADLVASWAEVITIVDGEEYIDGGNDIFHLEKEGSAWGVKELKRAVSAVSEKLPTLGSVQNKAGEEKHEQEAGKTSDGKKKPKTKEEEIQERLEYTANSAFDQILSYDKVIKSIVPHSKSLPSAREIPFHHEAFYANLHHYHTKLSNPSASFGAHLLYGEVVTSTNTLLDKNPSLLRNLPNGFTVTATTQVAAAAQTSGSRHLAHWCSAHSYVTPSRFHNPHPWSSFSTSPPWPSCRVSRAMLQGTKRYPLNSSGQMTSTLSCQVVRTTL
jgi:biotin--protein ligase